MVIMEAYTVGRWCNGNTPDSGSGYWGSSPCLPANLFLFNQLTVMRNTQNALGTVCVVRDLKGCDCGEVVAHFKPTKPAVGQRT